MWNFVNTKKTFLNFRREQRTSTKKCQGNTRGKYENQHESYDHSHHDIRTSFYSMTIDYFSHEF